MTELIHRDQLRPEDHWSFTALRDQRFLEDIGVVSHEPRPRHPLREQLKKGTQQVSGKIRQILSS